MFSKVKIAFIDCYRLTLEYTYHFLTLFNILLTFKICLLNNLTLSLHYQIRNRNLLNI